MRYHDDRRQCRVEVEVEVDDPGPVFATHLLEVIGGVEAELRRFLQYDNENDEAPRTHGEDDGE